MMPRVFYRQRLMWDGYGGADKNLDRVVTAREIFDFVSSGVKQISHNKQHPVMWGNFDDNLVLTDWR